MLSSVYRAAQSRSQLPNLIRHASKTTRYSAGQKKRFAREKVRKDELNRLALEAYGSTPKLDYDIYFTGRSLTKDARMERHEDKKNLLLDIYKHSTDHLLKNRDMTIISKIQIAKLQLIITRGLDQFIEIDGEIYDLNNKYTELNRRVYDYCYLQLYLDDYNNEELQLFMKLLNFKNPTLLQRDLFKYTGDISKSQKRLIALDALVGIDDLVILAAQKFQIENPGVVRRITELEKDCKVKTDFTDIQDTKQMRRYMKKRPIIFSGSYRLTLNHILTALKEEEEEQEADN